MSPKRVLSSSVLLVFSVVCPMIVAELCLRVAAGKTTATVFEDRPGFERDRGMKPSYEALVLGVPMMTNDLGFRDDEPRVAARSPGDFRLVLLGNSSSVGLGVPYDQIASSRLEQALATWMETMRAGPEVLNLAVGGYNVVQYRLVMGEIGWSLSPDFVVVAMFVAADFEARSNTSHRQRGLLPWHHRTRIWQRLAPRVRAVIRRAETAVAGGNAATGAADAPPFGPGAGGWSENAAALTGLKREADARGTPLVVFLLPTTDDFERQQSSHEIVADFCEDHEIACVDLLPEFAQGNRLPESYRLSVVDNHPNADYHRLVGNMMNQHVRRVWESWPSNVAARLDP